MVKRMWLRMRGIKLLGTVFWPQDALRAAVALDEAGQPNLVTHVLKSRTTPNHFEVWGRPMVKR